MRRPCLTSLSFYNRSCGGIGDDVRGSPSVILYGASIYANGEVNSGTEQPYRGEYKADWSRTHQLPATQCIT